MFQVLPAREQPVSQHATDSSASSGPQKAGSSYKRQLAEKLARNSGNDKNWNTLFFRSATVADAIAQRLGVQKEQVLDRHSDASMAVRMALAETQLIQETKEFLEDQGIRLASLTGADSDSKNNKPAVGTKKKKAKRSNVVILVKNIPFQTEPDEVRRLFSKYGELRKVVLPPAKTLCIVEYLEPNEAKKGFRSLAYKKFKTVPLYLEWAPGNVYMTAEEQKVLLDEREKQRSLAPAQHTPDEDPNQPVIKTLSIKNLNFDTTDEKLRYTFSRYGTVESAKVMMKPNPKKSEQAHKPYLSMGYGFVTFADAAGALTALQRQQGVELDGHQLVLSKAKRGSTAQDVVGKNKRKSTVLNSDLLSSTKLLIRNIAFQTTLKEVRELMTPFGKLKQCRLPTKFDGRTRGFAFAEFFSEQEAKNAYESLQHTHLYGRHLVVEWAKEDDDVAQLRAKTVSKFKSAESAAQGRVVKKSKKRRIDQLDDSDTSFLAQMESM